MSPADPPHRSGNSGSSGSSDPAPGGPDLPWYHGITPYMLLVLLIASLGWIFDVFEGQIFVASMREAMPALLPEGTDPGEVRFYNNVALGAFLLGGALGGVLFGALSDRIGRTRTMIITILVYSLFTCVTAFAQTWWQMAVLRFLVAMGVGGEWAVASTLVAEVFPNRSRAHVGAIFHGSSVFGTFLAVLAGTFVVGNTEVFGEHSWRWGFALGAVPALLTLWVRWKIREPEQWLAARARSREDRSQQTGRISDLFLARHLRNTVVGVGLATVGLATFWGVHIYGKNLALESAQALSGESDLKNAEMLGMLLTTAGGGLGLFLFGPICNRVGRRGAFLLYHLGGLVAALLLFQNHEHLSLRAIYCCLPVFGFLTLGMHAGYAVYFPELYPTRLRGTGAGFCFNFGRLLAAPILLVSGWMQRPPADGGLGLSLEDSASYLSGLFLVGVVLLIFARETRGRELPE
ncbi:MAG: MFS transporter [Planctomycetota bacterium]|nr:MFS transporter [Planctomycetota bacterium]